MAEFTRHEARERAVTLLYEAEQQSRSASDLIADLALPVDPYTATIVKAVADRTTEIDELISGASVDWTIDRMPLVDRNVLRVAIAELLTQNDIVTPIVIDEAVEIAKSLSTEDSGRFVNGVLSTVAAKVRD